MAANHNAAPMAMSVEKAAKGMIKNGNVSEGLLNMGEMAFRAYDPWHACATHALGQAPLEARIYSREERLLQTIRK